MSTPKARCASSALSILSGFLILICFVPKEEIGRGCNHSPTYRPMYRSTNPLINPLIDPQSNLVTMEFSYGQSSFDSFLLPFLPMTFLCVILLHFGPLNGCRSTLVLYQGGLCDRILCSWNAVLRSLHFSCLPVDKEPALVNGDSSRCGRTRIINTKTWHTAT